MIKMSYKKVNGYTMKTRVCALGWGLWDPMGTLLHTLLRVGEIESLKIPERVSDLIFKIV